MSTFTPEVVIYHGSCYDGFTAAWLLHREFPDAYYHPATYGSEPPVHGGKNILVVDFSYPRQTLIEMHGNADAMLVLDHHKTAEEALSGLGFCEFDMERAGCQMAWDWLYPDSAGKYPWLVEHVADRDLWKMALSQTRYVHAYYTSVPMEFDTWEAMHRMGRDNCVKLGKAIRQSIDRYCEKVGEHAIHMETPLGDCVVVNAPYLNSSELCHHLLQTTGAEWCCAWFQRGDRQIQYSLRSVGDFDVSRVARQYGGGGHLNAAGFSIDVLPWDLDWEGGLNG